jgi:hypothetical protein
MPLPSSPGSSHRGGCSSMAGESLHPHAVVHQVDFERVVVIAVVQWLLNIFGLFHSLSGIRLGTKDEMGEASDKNALRTRTLVEAGQRQIPAARRHNSFTSP